jgi:signal transduction histidine kinase
VKKKNNTPPAKTVNSTTGNADDQADFVANIGHDLKTYLNPIIGFTSVLLLEKTNLNSDQVHQLDLVYRSARQLLERIDAMVEFQRLIAGAKADQVDWVSIRELFLEVNQTFTEAAAQQGISLLENLEAAPARLRTSRLMLTRVLKEFVSNAVKFSEAGTVTLKTERIKQPDPQKVRLRFCVADSGSGLSPQLLTVLRAGFAAAPDSAKQSFAGLGLGLALAREAAKRLGGWLEVDSLPDQGSTFSLFVDFLADDLENEAG